MNAAFDIKRSGTDFAHPNSRVPYQHNRRAESDTRRFWVVAGYGPVPPHLRAPSHLYHAIEDSQEFGDYLGGPVWYANEEHPKCICEATFNELIDMKRSSKRMIASRPCSRGQMFLSLAGECHRGFFFQKVTWMGVIDIKTDDTVTEENISKSPQASREIENSFIYISPTVTDMNTKIKRPYFEISGDQMRVIDPSQTYDYSGVVLRRVADGKWFFKSGSPNSNFNSVCWHESVDNNEEYTQVYQGTMQNLKSKFRHVRASLHRFKFETKLKRFKLLVMQVLERHGLPNHLAPILLSFIMSREEYEIRALYDDGYCLHSQQVSFHTAGVGCFDELTFPNKNKIPVQNEYFERDFSEIVSDPWLGTIYTTMKTETSARGLPDGYCACTTDGAGFIQFKKHPETDKIVSVRIIFQFDDDDYDTNMQWESPESE